MIPHFQKLLLAVIVFISQDLLAQNSDSIKTGSKHSRFSIGIIASPEYCYRSLSLGSNANTYTPIIIESRNDRELPKAGFTVGVNVIYDLSERFSIESGINYSNKGYQYDLSGLTFGDMIDPRFGFIYQTQSAQSIDDDWDSWYYNYTYIDIPLMAVYTFPGRKIRFAIEGGFITNFLLDAYQTIGSTNQDLTSEFQDFGISAKAGAGAIYYFNEKIRLSLVPGFQYSVTSLRIGTINEHLWGGGISVGGFYHF